MRRPRRPAKAGGRGGGGGGEARRQAVVAVGVKDAEGVPVIAVGGEGEGSVLGVPVVAAAAGGGGEKGSLGDGIEAGENDALDGALVIAAGGEGEASVLGFPVIAAGGGRGGEKGPAEDGAAVRVKGAEGVAAIAVKGNGKAEKDEEGIKWLNHYSSAQGILIVGDGDFSFSLALATAFGSGENIVATSLDSYVALTRKYGKAEANVTELKRLGTTVLHGVDATRMKFPSCLKMRRFDRIVFNFPHAGFKGKEDHLHVINAHKQLVHGFFANARHLLRRPYGEIHLSHKTGLPYDSWDIEQLADDSCLSRVRTVDFFKEHYPGYNQKRGDSATCDQPFHLGPCCTFMFCLDFKKLKNAHANRVGSISCLGDSKFYPGISATDMRPFDLHPLAPAWPQPHFPPVDRVHMPVPFDPYPFGVAPMEHPGFPVNCYGTERSPYFHHQHMVQQMCRGPPVNVLPAHGGFHPPMRVSSPSFLAEQQPWYQNGPPIEPPWRGDYLYSPQEHQSLQREYEIHRQHTQSLEHRYLESVERRARLEMLIAHYGRQ